jgi:hypothetical protein
MGLKILIKEQIKCFWIPTNQMEQQQLSAFTPPKPIVAISI